MDPGKGSQIPDKHPKSLPGNESPGTFGNPHFSGPPNPCGSPVPRIPIPISCRPSRRGRWRRSRRKSGRRNPRGRGRGSPRGPRGPPRVPGAGTRTRRAGSRRNGGGLRLRNCPQTHLPSPGKCGKSWTPSSSTRTGEGKPGAAGGFQVSQAFPGSCIPVGGSGRMEIRGDGMGE